MKSAQLIPSSDDTLSVSFSPITERARLAQEWKAFQVKSVVPFFLSWDWIGPWMEQADSHQMLLATVTKAQVPAAMGIFCIRDGTACLHQYGIPSLDQIWIEYNGLLTSSAFANSALIATVRALLQQKLCKRVYLSMLPASAAKSIFEEVPFARIYDDSVGWKTDLGHLRNQGSDVLDSLSANTRGQIRRAIRLYESTYGDLVLARVNAPLVMERVWKQARDWHQVRWADSGFKNESFRSFHAILLKRGLDHGQASLYTVTFGTRLIGVFYFLFDTDSVRFYLQGLRSESDNKMKPGLVGHAVLMQHFMDSGWNNYDFMGGDHRYKRQLGKIRTEFSTVVVHNGNLRARIEDRLRPWINRIRQQ